MLMINDRVVLERELTKIFETVYGYILDNLIQWVEEGDNQKKGEFVILVQGVVCKK